MSQAAPALASAAGSARPAGPDLAWLGWGLTWLAVLLIPLAAAWQRSPDLAHGWAAPLLMLHLWWERLPRRAAPPAAPGWQYSALAIALVLAASGLRLFLEPFPLWPGALSLHAAALIALGGLFAFRLGGRAWLNWLLPPCIVLAGALPWPGIVDRVFIQPLREGLAFLAAECVSLFAQPAIAQGTSIRMAGGWVGIDEACGGIRSLQAAVMLALFFGELGRFGPGRRAALFFTGIAAALFGNFARILFLALAAGGSAEKVRAVHDLAGWLALGLTLAAVGAAAWLLRLRAKATVGTQTAQTPPAPATIRLSSPRPALRFVAACLLSLVAGEIAVRLWFDSGDAAIQASRWEASLPEKRPGYRVEPLGDVAREMLQPDDYQAGQWRDASGERVAAYAIEWRRGQLARTLPFLHNPTVCLPLAGCELREERGVRIFRLGDQELPFRTYLFARVGEEFLVSFVVWDPLRGQALRQPDDIPGLLPWLKSRWDEVRDRHRHQPAQMLCVAVYGPGAEIRTERLLENIVRQR